MEQQRYLIDTNAVIDYLGHKLPASGMDFMNGVIDDVPNISVITKIEVLGFNAPDEAYQLLVNFTNDAMVFNLTESIINICIEMRKSCKIKLPDAMPSLRLRLWCMALQLFPATRRISSLSRVWRASIPMALHDA